MLGIPAYLWRLLPANPILLRVVSIAGKRKRDLITRCGYLGLLIGVVIFSIVTTPGAGSGASLDQLTATSERIFQQMSFLQLFLVALLAPVFTAGAITQEKDSQTYDILLATPLTNGQIVLGSLLSRLFFIVALLVSGIPVFAVNKIFGGVAIGDIVISFFIAAATAFVTGALATAIATFKVGTRRTIFSFYMLCAVYLLGGYLLAQLDLFKIRLIDPATGFPGELSTTGWLSGIHPFLALQTLFAGNRAPVETLLPANLRGWPLEWYFTRPATFYPAFMFLLSAILVIPSIVLLRRMAQSSGTVTQSLIRKIPLRFLRGNRKPRTVWHNPVAWREARTKASAARASILRYGFILAGLTGAITILVLYHAESQPPKNYIQVGSYDAAGGTLLINGVNQVFAVEPGITRVRLDGRDVPTDRLTGRSEVQSWSTVTRRNVKVLDGIDLVSISGKISRRQAHEFLLGAILVEVAVIILIVTNAAASTVTREREDGTLDLLLSTPITSRYYLWGKLAGLVSFMLPLVLVPAVSAGLFVIVDAFVWLVKSDPHVEWLVLPESVLALPLVLTVVVAFATIVGMQMSLRNKTTVRSVMSSLGIVIGVMAMLGWCGMTALDSDVGAIAQVASAFSPLGVVAGMIYPDRFGGTVWTNNDPADIFNARITLLVFSVVATGIYVAVIWGMYKTMVKNFDMTIRRQS
jgi:ABC-type transport system involved in multi-copper enzyme maturation permease subunit